jgi:hypothetical protein
MIDLIPIILVAVLGVVGNIFYFEYRLKKERSKEVLKKRLTNLLLPLYYTLKDDELVIHAWLNSEADPYEYESDKPERLLNSLQKIIKENLYLADDELHGACIMFIEWAYKADKNERFQRVHDGDLVEDNVLKKFVEMVYKKYDETRKEYIK